MAPRVAQPEAGRMGRPEKNRAPTLDHTYWCTLQLTIGLLRFLTNPQTDSDRKVPAHKSIQTNRDVLEVTG